MTKDRINVLIMAAGSPLGQSIYKALLMSNLNLKIYLADISKMAAGFYLNKESNNIILPLLKDKNYFKKLKSVIHDNNIKVIFPVISVEHNFFENNIKYFNENHIEIITADKKLYNICNDKYLSMVTLRQKGINAPDTVLASNESDVEEFLQRNQFPVLLKPRFGASSVDVFKIQNRDKLFSLISNYSKEYFVLQQFLPDPEEYTIGVYISKDKSFKKSIIIKRELKFGLSYKGMVVFNEKIRDYAISLCESLGTFYSTNIQIKLIGGEPYAFEINPRLSSTTVVKAKFGFNEPEMILKELFYDLSTHKIDIRSGRFMRYWEEIYLVNGKKI